VSGEFEDKHKILVEPIHEFINSNDMKNLRLEMISGGSPSICNTCWHKENTSGVMTAHSKRISETNFWSKLFPVNTLIENMREDGTIPVSIVSYDLRMGNLCNLKCVMCNPNSSSKWLEDRRIIGKFPNTEFSANSLSNHKWATTANIVDQLRPQFKNIQLIQFAGGEPLLIKQHTHLLNELVRSNDCAHIFLKYNSNITIITDEILSLWNKFKRVDIWSSVDGVGELNDYIRFPSKWGEIISNLRMLDQTPSNVNVRINSTVGALNIEFIDELYTFFMDANFKKVGIGYEPSVHIAPDLIYFPAHLNLRTLHPAHKEKITDKLKTHLKKVKNQQYKDQRTYVLSYMNEEQWYSLHYAQLLMYINTLDKIRKNKYPHLSTLLKYA